MWSCQDCKYRFVPITELMRAEDELTAAKAEVEALRADAERWQCLTRHASLGFDGAPSWNAVIRLPVFDSADQTITALVDSLRAALTKEKA